MTNPRQYKIPDWFLNRQKDIVDGKYSQVSSNVIHFIWIREQDELIKKNVSLQLMSSNWDSKIREDLERLKKIRAHRGLRHYWG